LQATRLAPAGTRGENPKYGNWQRLVETGNRRVAMVSLGRWLWAKDVQGSHRRAPEAPVGLLKTRFENKEFVVRLLQRFCIIGVLSTIIFLLSACGSLSTRSLTATGTVSFTPEPTLTFVPTDKPEHTNTPESTATITPKWTLADVEIVKDGGFSFQPVNGFKYDVRGNQVVMISENEDIVLFMVSIPNQGSYPLDNILENFTQSVAERVGELEVSSPYNFEISDTEGLAVDIVGTSVDEPIVGRVSIVEFSNNMLFMTYGYATKERWENDGQIISQLVLDSLLILEPDSGSEESWDQYQTRTLEEMVRKFLEGYDALPDNSLITSGDPFPSKVTVTFVGEFRGISERKSQVIATWASRYMQQLSSEEVAELFNIEALFEENGEEYWLPVQTPLISIMVDELPAISDVTLMLVWAGAVKFDDENEWVLLVNAFEEP